MHFWEDTGIVISVTKYGETSALLRVLTSHHGLFPGMVKGAFSKTCRGIYQPGNILHIHWQARLEEQLGQMRCELLKSSTAELLSDPYHLHLMNTVFAWIIHTVPERINERNIYKKIILLLDKIHSLNEDKAALLRDYVEFEFTLLHALGFGLDLSCCAATGQKAELVYVSPKSGRAVSRVAGQPYHAKMLPLPEFLQNPQKIPDLPQMLDGLALTGYFLDSWVLQPEGKKVPEARYDLLRFLHKQKI